MVESDEPWFSSGEEQRQQQRWLTKDDAGYGGREVQLLFSSEPFQRTVIFGETITDRNESRPTLGLKWQIMPRT